MDEKRNIFLAVLFDDDVKGNYRKAARKAGYSDQTTTHEIVHPIRDKIKQATDQRLADLGVKAAVAMGDLIDDPTSLGAKNKLAAAKDLLDRAGYKPRDKVEVEHKNSLFILPEKKDNAQS